MSHPTLCVKQAYLAMRRCMDESLAPFGLTAAQFDVIQHLLEHDGLEHRVLQEHLAVSSPTLTTIVDGLVARGFVERRLSPEDARVKQLFLTSAAHQLHSQLDEAGRQFQALMFADFSPHEVGLFLHWLNRLTANLERGCPPAKTDA
jgi:DNA-binding MarR family transcriptional regulator